MYLSVQQKTIYLTISLLQLLVNKKLYEKTLVSGFGSVYFLLYASEQQQVTFNEQAKA